MSTASVIQLNSSSSIDICDWKHICLHKQTILTVGNFDGFHQGHQFILRELYQKSQDFNLNPVVLTFDPHPRTFFKKSMQQIDSLEEKIKRIKHYVNVKVVVVHFNQEFSELDPEVFIDSFLKQRLQVQFLLQGTEHFFGKNRRGSTAMLRKKIATVRFPDPLLELKSMQLKSVLISSSIIRQLLKNGEIEKSNKLLGRSFGFAGLIVKGRGIGKTIGFPTINLAVDKFQLIPQRGVYGGCIILDGKCYLCLVNIGMKPTFSSIEESIEAYLLEFNQQIYGKIIFLKLYFRIREEIKFNSVRDLSQQIEADLKYFHSKMKKGHHNYGKHDERNFK